MKILLLGNTGQLGWELERCLSPLGSVVATDYPDLDMADETNIRRWVSDAQPDVIMNATAYTNVDGAENQPDLAMAINGFGPGILADEAKRRGAALIHYSTDYVFDGAKGEPYFESDTPNPLGTYGKSKLAGEQAIQDVGGAYLILRTSWVYSLRRPSFVTKLLQWSRQQQVLRVVSDQVGNPTWSRTLAEISALLLARAGDDVAGRIGERRGIYHLAGSGYASRLKWAEAVLQLDPHRNEQMVEEILPALTTDFPTPALRPLFSALNCDRFSQTFGLCLPDWEEALRLAMASD